MQGLGLVADIGATNTRLALVEPGGAVTRVRVFATDESPDLGNMIEAYLAAEDLPARPTAALLAIAAPVTGDEITLTNFPWTFSIHELRDRLGLKALRVINDFVANAYALPHLRRGRPHAGGLRRAGGRGAERRARPGLGPRRQRLGAGGGRRGADPRRGRPCHHGGGRRARGGSARSAAPALRSRLGRARAVRPRHSQSL